MNKEKNLSTDKKPQNQLLIEKRLQRKKLRYRVNMLYEMITETKNMLNVINQEIQDLELKQVSMFAETPGMIKYIKAEQRMTHIDFEEKDRDETGKIKNRYD